ncbi:GGDEF domain-containing protein [Trichococcus paludicola]|uniref:GGDEF domain-containing protein n=1 Tax=Trichococcus paludicola TaxID=2052942 RepID=UPI0018FF79CB|nr:GGDEF domain-containing protein [Trichococcus paludicola]
MIKVEINLKGFQTLISQLTTFEKMYEQVRIVDPIKKEVLFVKNKNQEELMPVLEACFGIWGKGTVCKNCISMRAYNENDTFIKIETSLDKIIMVTAIPVKIEDRMVVVELLKNVTKSMILGDRELTESLEIKRLLEQANVAAVTDELTQIYNKRYIIERLPADMVKSHLENQPISVLMADIDHFKKVNDTYGHLAGDHILKEVAGILGKNTRQDVDWIARFGGEEFIVCLTNTDKKIAGVIADRMRKAIEDTVFSYNGEKIKLTSSFGLYTITSEEMIDYETLIHRSDKKLYEAKKSGRNKVVG